MIKQLIGVEKLHVLINHESESFNHCRGFFYCFA